MDFGVQDDELDYEEDGIESDSFKNSESMNGLGEGQNMNRNCYSCKEEEEEEDEDYLQINCSEEEEIFISGEQTSETVASEEADNSIPEPPSETVKPEIKPEEAVEARKVQKADEGSEKAKEQKVFRGKKPRTRTSQLSDFKYNNCNADKKKIKKKRPWSFPRRPAIKKKLANSPTHNPWLREYDFLDSCDMMKRSCVAPCNNDLLHSQRNCLKSGRPAFPLQSFGAIQQERNLQQGEIRTDKRFVSSNSPMGIAVDDRNLTQQLLKPVVSESLTPFKEDIAEFETNGHNRMNHSKNLGCNNSMNYNGFSKNESLKSARQNQENSTQNCRVDEKKADCRNTIIGSNVRNAGCNPLRKCFWKYGAESTMSFLSERKKCDIKINALKDDEKELVKLKKEARRKRFMQDVDIKKEKEPFESNASTKLDGCLPKDVLKMEGAQLLEEKFQLGENKDFKDDHGSLLETKNLKKELLLKKRNPFEGSVEMTTCTAGTKIKQELLWNENLKVENAENPILKEAKVEKEFRENGETKVLGGLYPNGPGPFVVKNETGSQVKFVRTISRSLDELGFGKSKTGVISEKNDECTFELKPFPFANEGLQEQVTRQLTGCIVKVLNIPPSTTTNDILSLCRSIGIVREMKLNFPKENSAVIRFAEPSSAENFFSLYHGQKMNNYFLNVIII